MLVALILVVLELVVLVLVVLVLVGAGGGGLGGLVIVVVLVLALVMVTCLGVLVGLETYPSDACLVLHGYLSVLFLLLLLLCTKRA